MQVSVTCRHCGEEHLINVNARRYTEWKEGKELIQRALPELTPEERELLKTQTCGKCWDEMLGYTE